MELSAQAIKDLARDQGVSLNELLERAGVSKTAYYSLVRKDSVLPKSIHALAEALGVNPSKLVSDPNDERERVLRRTLRAKAIVEANPRLDPDNVRHTLLLLDKDPVDRLRGALLRGQTFDFH